MAIEIKQLDNGKGVEFILSETVYGKDIIKTHKEWHKQQALAGLKYKIVNKSQVDHFYVSHEEVKEISELDKQVAKINPDLIIAIISPNEILDAMAGLWQANLREAAHTRLFLARDEAERWIREVLQKE